MQAQDTVEKELHGSIVGYHIWYTLTIHKTTFAVATLTEEEQVEAMQGDKTILIWSDSEQVWKRLDEDNKAQFVWEQYYNQTPQGMYGIYKMKSEDQQFKQQKLEFGGRIEMEDATYDLVRTDMLDRSGWDLVRLKGKEKQPPEAFLIGKESTLRSQKWTQREIFYPCEHFTAFPLQEASEKTEIVNELFKQFYHYRMEYIVAKFEFNSNKMRMDRTLRFVLWYRNHIYICYEEGNEEDVMFSGWDVEQEEEIALTQEEYENVEELYLQLCEDDALYHMHYVTFVHTLQKLPIVVAVKGF